MASGSPSSARHTSLDVGGRRVRGTSAGAGSRVRVNRATESAIDSGSSWCTDSPSMPSGTWLVARIRTRGRGVDDPADDVGQVRDEMLAVVEHEQRVETAQPVEHHRLGGRAHAERLADARPERRTVRRRPAGPARRRRRRARATSMASRVLPTPAGPATVTSRCPVDAPVRRGEVGVAPDQRGGQRRAGCPAARPAARHPSGCRIAAAARAGRTGVQAEVVGQQPRTRRYAASASAWRPARYSAVISSVHSPSRSGCSATRASSSPTTRRPRRGPSGREVAPRSGAAAASSRRARYGSSHAPSPAPGSTSPRNIASPPRRPRGGAASRLARRGRPASRSTSSASTRPGRRAGCTRRRRR